MRLARSMISCRVCSVYDDDDRIWTSRPRTKAVMVSDLFIVGRTDCLREWSSLLISWLMSSLSSQVWQG